MVMISSWSPPNELLKLNRGPKTRNKKLRDKSLNFDFWSSWFWVGRTFPVWSLSEWWPTGCQCLSQLSSLVLAVCEQIFKLVTIEWTSSTLGVINLRWWSPQHKTREMTNHSVPIGHHFELEIPHVWESCNMKEANSKWWQTFLTKFWLFLFLAGDGRFKLITADEASNSGVTNLQMVTPTQN